jgi:hypothetical protein
MQAGRRLYVGRIPQAATRADFEEFFGRMGKLVDVRIMAGFAFIEYADLRVSRMSARMGTLARTCVDLSWPAGRRGGRQRAQQQGLPG